MKPLSYLLVHNQVWWRWNCRRKSYTFQGLLHFKDDSNAERFVLFWWRKFIICVFENCNSPSRRMKRLGKRRFSFTFFIYGSIWSWNGKLFPAQGQWSQCKKATSQTIWHSGQPKMQQFHKKPFFHFYRPSAIFGGNSFHCKLFDVFSLHWFSLSLVGAAKVAENAGSSSSSSSQLFFSSSKTKYVGADQDCQIFSIDHSQLWQLIANFYWKLKWHSWY